MILSKEQIKEFEELVKPVIKFLNETGHPYAKAIVDIDSAEITFMSARILCADYIQD